MSILSLINMKLDIFRRVMIISSILIPIVFSLILSVNLNVDAAAQNNDYVVGGTIIPTNNLLGPWIGAIAILSLIVAVVFWRGKKIPTT